MPDEPQTSGDAKKGKGFFKELSGSAAKRLLEPLVTTAATAGTAYLMRKTTKLWNESVLPKVREKGGGKAFVKDALEQAAGKLPEGRGSEFVQGLAKHFEDKTPARKTSSRAAEQPAKAETSAAQDAATDPKRERQRQERQRRREQRQRELAKTRST
ncbi:MAG TPA: hypothetical protein VE757_06230 [Gaiellaceae bacterium]|nr:hypothetical protein [Gaiellaceae bacterium]